MASDLVHHGQSFDDQPLGFGTKSIHLGNGVDKETINNCYVTDGSRKLVGVVSLRALVLAKDTAEPIRDLMDTSVVSVTTTTDQEDVSHLLSLIHI